MPVTQADSLLSKVYEDLELTDDEAKYENVYHIIKKLEAIHKVKPVGQGTTGTITERLVEVAL